MRELVEKLRRMEKAISRRKGGVELFALFLREGSPRQWDLLVSAPWITRNKKDGLRYISNMVQQQLSSYELHQISRVAIIEDSEPALQAFQQAIKNEHGVAELVNCSIFGLQVEHAYLITSQSLKAKKRTKKKTAKKKTAKKKTAKKKVKKTVKKKVKKKLSK